MLTRRKRLAKQLKRIKLRIHGVRGQASPVFVLGEMRSGTNMLAQALERHDHIECFHEADEEAFDNFVLRPPEVIRSLVTSSHAKRVVFKSIADMGRSQQLFTWFPDAQAIFIYRHFEDVINSALKNFSGHNDYIRLIIEDSPAAGWRRWGISEVHIDLLKKHYQEGMSEASARALIWYIRNQSFLEQGLIESGKLAILSYESLTTDPQHNFTMAAYHIGLQYSNKMCKGVSTKSIRRQPAPNIDSGIYDLCQGLLDQLDSYANRYQDNFLKGKNSKEPSSSCQEIKAT